MNIEILHLIEGARKAHGLTVIIDVFRASSLACYLFDRGAEKIIPVGKIELAYKLKEQHPDYILIGERNNKKPPGFSFGNSPYEILNQDFSGKTVIHTTSAGTQGIVNAKKALKIITGSFVNAGAVIKFIKHYQPRNVSLVGMGYAGTTPIEEDTFCAEYIRNGLEGKKSNFSAMVETIRKTSGRRFFDPKKADYNPPEDFGLCLDLNAFNFVLEAVSDDKNIITLKKVIL